MEHHQQYQQHQPQQGGADITPAPAAQPPHVYSNPNPNPNPTPDPNGLAPQPLPPAYQPEQQGVPATTNEKGAPPPAQTAAPQVHVFALNQLREDSQTIICPRCHKQGPTRTEKVPNGSTHCFAVLICCFLSCLCAWIPYVVKSCNDIEHHCSSCGVAVALHSEGGTQVLPIPQMQAPSAPATKQ